MTISRRNFARGSAWAAPTLVVAAAAPAVAASPCAGIVKGQPLPVSAFVPVYVGVTGQIYGITNDKNISLAAGIKINPAILSCIGTPAITMGSSTAASSITLTNGKTYSATGGTESTSSGTAGTSAGCSGGDGSAQVCTTMIYMQVVNSAGTSSANPKAISYKQTVTVAGYGTTIITINASGFVYNSAVAHYDGTGLSIS